MIQEFVQATVVWIKRVISQPRGELDRWQRTVRFGYDLMKHGGKQLNHDRAPQMAAALAFRTLFALLPVLVVATIVVKAVKGTDTFLQLIHSVLASTQLADIQMVPPSDVAPSADGMITLAQWLEGLVGQAAEVNLAAVGWIGFAVIIYAAIGLMVTIENAFNTVYRAPEGRAWTRRVPLYWFVLTISPVALAITWYLNGQFTEWMEYVAVWQTFLSAARVVWSVALGWLLLFAIYTLIPNTSIAIRPALIGALVSSILLEIGKRSLAVYLENAFSISQLYGSLGLVPLFMFWMYLMWLAVLFGLELSATLQMLPGRDLEEVSQRQAAGVGLFDAASVITVVQVVAERFREGKSTAISYLADVSALPDSLVVSMVQQLVDAKILHRVEAGEGAVTLARPPEQIHAEELIEVGFKLVDGANPVRHSPLVDKLRNAQKRLVAKTTLANLVSLGDG